MMLKAELETLKQEHRQLINIHTKSNIQKDKISIATQTEVCIYVHTDTHAHRHTDTYIRSTQYNIVIHM